MTTSFLLTAWLLANSIPTADDRLGSQIRGQLAQERESGVSVEEQEPPLEELLDNARSIREYLSTSDISSLVVENCCDRLN
jgi:hypothetical protein